MGMWILSLSSFLHILATVVWIGGIYMILLVILPGAKAGLEPAMVGKLMKEITKKFTAMANISILVLIATGILIAYYSEENWNAVMILKHFLVALMIGIHFWRMLILNPKIGRLSSQDEIVRLQRFSLFLVKTNLILGIIVLLLTGISLSL